MTATVLTGIGNTSYSARSQLLTELKIYIEKDEWAVQGGISHTIDKDDVTLKSTHYFSVLLIKQ